MTFFVAELGINHNGDLDLAKALIAAAQGAGADVVKFQKRDLSICYTPAELALPRESPFGTTNGDLKRRLEFGEAEYREIDRFCADRGIRWTASPWDLPSLEFLCRFEVPYIKIASPCVTDKALLEAACRTGLPLQISTGMCDQALIDRIVAFVEGCGGKIDCLYHCTSSYPSEDDEVNLSAIPFLRKRFPRYNIGYSGHERGIAPSFAAAILGATHIERHFTLDRTAFGSDQAVSLEPQGFARMVRDIRRLPDMLGDGVIRVYERERPIITKLRRVNGFD